MVRIEVEEKDKAVIVRITGEFSLSNISEFEKVFKKYLNSKLEVVALDLSGMPYLDSLGISRIIKISRAFTGVADFVLLNINDDIMQIFRMATFDRIFNIMTEEEFKGKYFPKIRDIDIQPADHHNK